MGGWVANDPTRSTMLNVYTPQTVDIAGSHWLNATIGEKLFRYMIHVPDYIISLALRCWLVFV